jgi:hypothetical protein
VCYEPNATVNLLLRSSISLSSSGRLDESGATVGTANEVGLDGPHRDILEEENGNEIC